MDSGVTFLNQKYIFQSSMFKKDYRILADLWETFCSHRCCHVRTSLWHGRWPLRGECVSVTGSRQSPHERAGEHQCMNKQAQCCCSQWTGSSMGRRE